VTIGDYSFFRLTSGIRLTALCRPCALVLSTNPACY